MRPVKTSPAITFGKRLSQIAVAGVLITETEHGPDSSLGFHDHEAPNINFVLGGSHVERFRSREMYCGRGSLVVKPGGAVHANQYGHAGSHAVIVEFPSAAGADWSQVFEEVRWVEGGLPSAHAWQVVGEARQQTTGWELRVEESLLALCAEIAQRQPGTNAQSNSWFSNVREYLESNHEQELTIRGTAAVFGVHPVYLTRAFRKRFGCTVAQFIRRKRLDRAVREITSTSKKMAEIAVECGFYDQSHLTNVLRDVTGLSPTKLRGLATQ
jgi:AraC family transcriptional regulator